MAKKTKIMDQSGCGASRALLRSFSAKHQIRPFSQSRFFLLIGLLKFVIESFSLKNRILAIFFYEKLLRDLAHSLSKIIKRNFRKAEFIKSKFKNAELYNWPKNLLEQIRVKALIYFSAFWDFQLYGFNPMYIFGLPHRAQLYEMRPSEKGALSIE